MNEVFITTIIDMRKYRPPKKQLSEEEIKHRLACAFQERVTEVEQIIMARHSMTPLICALTNTTIDESISQSKERVAYLDDLIADMQSRLPYKVSIRDFIG